MKQIIKNNAMLDLKESILKNNLWFYLAIQEIKFRYRRSMLGPLWITLTTLITLTVMGPIYGILLKQPFGPYFCYLTISYIFWNFISNYINESCSLFILSENYIKNIRIPYISFHLKLLYKNLIIMIHNIIIIPIVYFIFPIENYYYIPLFLIGLLVLTLNLFWIGLIFSIIAARYRDLIPIINSATTLIFFVTPIMWSPEMLGNKIYLAEYNPIFQLLDIIRSPLLGLLPSYSSIFFSIIYIIIGIPLSLYIFKKYYSKINLWI